MSEEKKTKLDEVDLWKMRALFAQQESLVSRKEETIAKARLMQVAVNEIDVKLEGLKGDLAGFDAEVREKYGDNVQVKPDGTLEFPAPKHPAPAKIEEKDPEEAKEASEEAPEEGETEG